MGHADLALDSGKRDPAHLSLLRVQDPKANAAHQSENHRELLRSVLAIEVR